MRCSVKKLWIWLRHTWLVKFYFVELSERLYFGVFKWLYIHNNIGGFSQLIEMPENNSSNVKLTDAYKYNTAILDHMLLLAHVMK